MPQMAAVRFERKQDQESTRDANPRAVRGRSIDAVPNKSLELTPKPQLARSARVV